MAPAPGLYDFEIVMYLSFIDADDKTTSRVDAHPRLEWQGRAARPKVRQGNKNSTTTFMALR